MKLIVAYPPEVLMNCPHCKSEDWIEGRVEGKGLFQFRPKESKLMVITWPTINARTCRVCGHVQFSVEVEKLKGVLKD